MMNILVIITTLTTMIGDNNDNDDDDAEGDNSGDDVDEGDAEGDDHAGDGRKWESGALANALLGLGCPPLGQAKPLKTRDKTNDFGSGRSLEHSQLQVS